MQNVRPTVWRLLKSKQGRCLKAGSATILHQGPPLSNRKKNMRSAKHYKAATHPLAPEICPWPGQAKPNVQLVLGHDHMPSWKASLLRAIADEVEEPAKGSKSGQPSQYLRSRCQTCCVELQDSGPTSFFQTCLFMGISLSESDSGSLKPSTCSMMTAFGAPGSSKKFRASVKVTL